MTKVKVCGITNVEDALAAVEYGADAVGFIFAESPRQVSRETVRQIVRDLPPFVSKVGVFADAELSEVTDTLSACGLDLVQLHGKEGPEYCSALFPRAIKVFTPATLPSTDELDWYAVTAYLFDREKGSDVRPQDLWLMAREVIGGGRVILAGGLTPENVAQAIRVVQPYAVDVSSGVESEPGRKDHARMKTFIETVRRGNH